MKMGEIPAASSPMIPRSSAGVTPRLALVGIIALVAAAIAIWRIQSFSDGLTIEATHIGDIPATIFRNAAASPEPVVVIAHGFAGSQQLMQPIAETLARNGYVAITFDLAGHGRNPLPLAGGVADLDRSTKALLAEIADVVAFARALPAGDHRVALVGHSFASDLVVQYGMGDPDIVATAALSLFGAGVTAREPRDLLVIDGAWELSMLKDAALRIANLTAGGDAQPGVTYGDLSSGTARRVVYAEGAEHIGVIYARDSLKAIVAWMNGAFGRTSSGVIDRRGKWLALLFAGLVALAAPAARLLPVVARRRLGAGLPWSRFAPAAIVPAVLTPLILWKAPTNFLPILLGDYLVVHFAIYGALTSGAVWLLRPKARPRLRLSTLASAAWPRIAIGAVSVTAFYVLAIGLPINAYVTSFMPTERRWPLILAMFCGCAIYFLADEWLTRGERAARGATFLTKLCFVLSLAAAVALNPQKLFFLAIIVPVILVLFVVYGLVSRWVYARTNDPRVAALGEAFALAWAIAVTFPVVG
jgi:hypothetical protein